MYRTYNFRPTSPPSPCVVLPGAIAKGLTPMKLKPDSKNTLDNSVVLSELTSRPKRSNNKYSGSTDNIIYPNIDPNKKSGFKEYTFILPSGHRRRVSAHTKDSSANRHTQITSRSSTHHIYSSRSAHSAYAPKRPSSSVHPSTRPSSTRPSSAHPSSAHPSSTHSSTNPSYIFSRVSFYSLTPSICNIRTTDHYSHWYDNKSCSGRINSGNLKDNMLGNIEVSSLYTTVTPKSFIPPSPLRTKQFVMPLKLQQLEPQKKPLSNSDLTVTFVHRKMSDSNGTVKSNCNKTTGSTTTASPSSTTTTTTTTTTAAATSKSHKTSSNSSHKNSHKNSESPPQQPGYPDPTDGAPVAFINRLAEMTSHQGDTVRMERSKRGKNRTRIS